MFRTEGIQDYECRSMRSLGEMEFIKKFSGKCKTLNAKNTIPNYVTTFALKGMSSSKTRYDGSY